MANDRSAGMTSLPSNAGSSVADERGANSDAHSAAKFDTGGRAEFDNAPCVTPSTSTLGGRVPSYAHSSAAGSKFRSGWKTTPKVPPAQAFVPETHKGEGGTTPAVDAEDGGRGARQRASAAQYEERKNHLDEERRALQREREAKHAELKRLEEEVEREKAARSKRLDEEISAKRAELERLELERVAHERALEERRREAATAAAADGGGGASDVASPFAAHTAAQPATDESELKKAKEGTAGHQVTESTASETEEGGDSQRKRRRLCAGLLVLLLLIGGVAGLVFGLGKSNDDGGHPSSSVVDGAGVGVLAGLGNSTSNITYPPTSLPSASVFVHKTNEAHSDSPVLPVLTEPASQTATGSPAQRPAGMFGSDPLAPEPTDPSTARPVVTNSPTTQPSAKPGTIRPTKRPTSKPVSDSPTKRPTPKPVANTKQPSAKPVTIRPTKRPTSKPVSDSPTKRPTSKPVANTKKPSAKPVTIRPTKRPTSKPVSDSPTKRPTSKPIAYTKQPSAKPVTIRPTKRPTSKPVSDSPTKRPTPKPVAYTKQPSAKPLTIRPTKRPTSKPVSDSPTKLPTSKPVAYSPIGSSILSPVVDRSCEYVKSQGVYVSAPLTSVDQQMYGGTSDFDGDTAVVVAHDEIFSSLGAGSIWILGKNSAGAWEQTGTVPSDGGTEQFGWDVATRGGTIVLGAPGYGGTASLMPLDFLWVGRGRAVVMAKDFDGGWQRQAVLSPSVADSGAGFGKSVDVAECGCFIAVGAWLDRDRRGSVFLYSNKQSNGSWNEIQKLAPSFSGQSESGSHGNFGYTVVIKDDLLAVKAPYDYIDGVRGVVYVYKRGPGGTYEEIDRLATPEGEQITWHGNDVAFLDGFLLVGAPGNRKVYVFEQTNSGGYQKTTELTGSDINEESDDGIWGSFFGGSSTFGSLFGGSSTFGSLLDGEGTNVMIGDTGGASSYLFSFEDGVWKERAKFDNELASLSGNSIVAHAPLSFETDFLQYTYGGQVSFYDLVCDP